MKTYRVSKVDVIATSLLGKYVDWEIERLTEFTRSKAQKRNRTYQRNKFDQEFIPEVLINDILRQLDIFDSINSNWLDKPLSLDLILEINSMANGLEQEKNSFRSFEHVPDFGGEALTASNDIQADLMTFEVLLETANKYLENDRRIHSRLMADVFFGIIRIHPFPDGNGRTARFMVELMARKWGYQYIIIPKYRNDAIWRNALDKAAEGDNSAIELYFLERLQKIQ